MDSVQKTDKAHQAVTHKVYTPFNLDQSEYLTTTQLQHRLEVAPLTISHWRKLSPSIPHETRPRGEQRHFVVFPIIAVDKWLERYKPSLLTKFRENTCDCRYCGKQDSDLPVLAGINPEPALAI